VVPQSGYGMTETCSHQYTRPDDPPLRIIDTSGRACDGLRTACLAQDNPDVEAAPGEIGEIGGRGASLMLGYFDDQASTDAAFNAAGYFMTGDLGQIDEAGYLRITAAKRTSSFAAAATSTRADRGAGAAASADRAGGGISGARSAARRADVSRNRAERRRDTRPERDSRTPGGGGLSISDLPSSSCA